MSRTHNVKLRWLKPEFLRPEWDWYCFLMRRATLRIGILGVVGVFLSLAAIWLAIVDIPAAKNERDRLLAQSRAIPALARTNVPAASLLKQLEPLLEGPSDLKALPTDLMNAFAMAGAQVSEASFSVVSQQSIQGVKKTQIVGTVQGSYPAIKAGLNDLLEMHPTLALDSVVLSQMSPSESVVNAKLQFVHWSRSSGARSIE